MKHWNGKGIPGSIIQPERRVPNSEPHTNQVFPLPIIIAISTVMLLMARMKVSTLVDTIK